MHPASPSAPRPDLQHPILADQELPGPVDFVFVQDDEAGASSRLPGAPGHFDGSPVPQAEEEHVSGLPEVGACEPSWPGDE